MADSTIILPPVATTSGDLLDATLLGTVKRERMVVGNDVSTDVAIVTTSGALSVVRSTAVSLSSAISLSSGLITLSSAIGISSGLITLTGTNVVTNASSGLIQVLQSTGAWAVTGGGSTAVNLIGSTGTQAVVNSVGALAAQLMGSSGLTAIVSSSGALSVLATFSATSTASNIIGSTGTTAVVTSSGALSVTMSTAGGSGSTSVSIEGAAGVEASVSSSYGLAINHRTTGRTFGTILSTVGAPLSVFLTTAAIWVYSITIVTTAAGTAGNAMGFHTATSALSTNTPVISMTNGAAAGAVNQLLYPSGVLFNTGLNVSQSLTFGTTGTNTGAAVSRIGVEYEV